MSGFGFDTLALLVVIGMAGPLLAAVPRLGIPVVVGELVAGIAVGRTGFGIVDASDPTFTLLANVGFALVMFVVGTHVPVRDSTLRGALPKALLRAVLVGAVAAILGVALAAVFDTGHAALYAVLMASSSAALALPVIDSLGLGGPQVLSVTAQIAIADAASIVLLPLVIDPGRAPRAALGALAIVGGAAVLYMALRYFDRRGLRKRLHHYSEDHRQALELRINLIILFGLAALAVATHVSIMLAGFALGLVRSANPAGSPGSCSASPRASSGRCSSCGSAPHCRYASSPTIPSSSPSASASVSERCWPIARAGCSVNRWALACWRRHSSAYPSQRPRSASSRTCSRPVSRRR
jgi:Kef-type K+ transport system membrane component KefB